MVTAAVIPDGIPKSGRVWKKKQTARFSSIKRQGVLKHMSTSYEKKMAQRDAKDQVKQLEKEMKEERQRQREAERLRREEKKKRLAENEYKNASFQVINANKLKTMSKKQLRQVKKTSVNKLGKVELVNAYAK